MHRELREMGFHGGAAASKSVMQNIGCSVLKQAASEL